MQSFRFFAVLFSAVLFLMPSCDLAEPEIGVPDPNRVPEVFFDDGDRLVQDQNTLAQFLTTAVQVISKSAAEQILGLSSTGCGTMTTMPDNITVIDFTDDLTEPNMPGCNLAQDLRVLGTLEFEIISTENNDLKIVQLRFTTFKVNGRDITLENQSAGAPRNITFEKVSGPETAYRLFNITMPLGQTVKVSNNANGIASTTDFCPFGFNFDNTPVPVFAKLRINNNGSTDLASLADLESKDYVLKIEKNNDPNFFPGNDDAPVKFWTAKYVKGSVTENYTIITGGEVDMNDNENIPGLSFDLDCGHFYDGILLLRRQANSGCYYKYRDYDFGYEEETGDVKGNSITCGNPAPAATGSGFACDDWVQVTSYSADSGNTPCNLAGNILAGNCAAINQNCAGVCTIEQCF